MKFGDIITAVASVALVSTLLYFVLLAVFLPVNYSFAPSVAGFGSIFFASLIVGYVFAAKINDESRRGAIARIAVLVSVVVIFVELGYFSNPYTGAWIKETLQNMYSTSGWATFQWVVYSNLIMSYEVALNAGGGFALSFVGLWVGSMRKSRKI